MVVGKYHRSAPPALTIRGDLAGTAYEATLAAANVRRHEGGVPLAALWARQRIQDLMDRMWEHPS